MLLITCVDVFLTVLYARSKAGVFTPRVQRGIWQLFRIVAARFHKSRQLILSFAGPCMAVVIPVVWVGLIMIAYALMYWPTLGSGFIATHGQGGYNFLTAVYISGYSLTTLGLGDYIPATSFYRLLFMSESFVGFSVITLVITFLVEVYNAVHSRNVLTVMLHHRSGNTGDAGELVARLGAHGDFEHAGRDVSEIASNLVEILEHHHSYPITYYFVFEQVHYCIARMTLLSMETATIIRSLLPHDKYATFTDSSSVVELFGSAKHLIDELAGSFLTAGLLEEENKKSEQCEEVWRKRAVQIRAALQSCEIPTADQMERAVEKYVELRRNWDYYIKAFARHSVHDWREVAPGEASLT